jgi:small subunit ribosomal protein S17
MARTRKKQEEAVEQVAEAQAATTGEAGEGQKLSTDEPAEGQREEPAGDAPGQELSTQEPAEGKPEAAPEGADKPSATAKRAAKRKAEAKAKPAAKGKAAAPAGRKEIVRLRKPEHPRGRRKERRGVVVSNAMDKTIVVRVDVAKPHPRYKKVVRRSQRLHVHDEGNRAHVGDVVRVVETRPLSRTKFWRLAEIVEAAR